jgi:hypothetical protein
MTTFGSLFDTSKSSGGGMGPVDTKRVALAPLYEAGTVTKITGWVYGSDSNKAVKAILYDKSSANPGALLKASDERTILTADANAAVDFTWATANPHLVAGNYALGYHLGAGGGGWNFAAGTGTQGWTGSDTYSDGTADPFGTAVGDQYQLVIYATYTPDVVDVTPPVVSITSPAAGTTQTGTITVNVTATDNVNVKTVDLLAAGVVFQTVTAAIGQTSFSFTVDTRAFVNNKIVNLSARATDPQGNTATTTAVPITINNSSVYIPELSGDKITEYRLNKEKFGSAVKVLEYDRFALNVLDYGAIPDGEVNPATGVVSGTDNTVAFQTAADAAYALGCREVTVPHAGPSKFIHGDGSPLDRGYRIGGQVTLKRNVAFIGAAEGKTGGNQGAGVSGGHATSLALEIPPSANPTLLIENSSTSAFVLQNANTFKNFNFLWPGQIKPPYSGVSPTVFPAGIEMQGHDMKIENLTDYNSYIFIKRTGGSVHTHIKGIASSSHKSIIQDTGEFAEWEISEIDYNGGTIYNSGVNTEPIGPLLDLYTAGPSFLHHVGINCSWLNKQEAIRVTTSGFGLIMDNIWIDTITGRSVISINQASYGGGNFAAINQYNNLHITRGCTAKYALTISYPDANLGGGANQNSHQISNSHFWQKVLLVGGAEYLFSNCILQAGFDLNGTSTSSALGQRLQISNSTGGGSSGSGGGAWLRSRGGKNFVQMSNIGANQLSQVLYCDRVALALGTVTITIASPAVLTMASHELHIGQPVTIATTGALPTGLTAGTTYYVSSAGFATDTFQLSTSFANALTGTSINTSGSQSGTHTLSTVPGTLHVANLDGLRTLRWTIPAGTILATGETVIGEEFEVVPAGTSISWEMTVMETMGTGANGDQWKIAKTYGATNAVLFTSNLGPASGGGTTYVGGSRATGPILGNWFSEMVDPIYSFAESGPGGNFVGGWEIRYINNTGAPVTVPARGFHLTLTYCCM